MRGHATHALRPASSSFTTLSAKEFEEKQGEQRRNFVVFVSFCSNPSQI
jgi:hypothetical protein